MKICEWIKNRWNAKRIADEIRAQQAAAAEQQAARARILARANGRPPWTVAVGRHPVVPPFRAPLMTRLAEDRAPQRRADPS